MAQEIIPTGPLYPAYAGRAEGGGSSQAAKQLFFVLFKWWRLIFSFFLVFTFAAGIAMYLKPPVRSAFAEVLINANRTPLQISGLASTQRSVLSQIMNSERQLIKSRQVLGSVAIKLLSRPDKNVGEDEISAKINSLDKSMVAVALPDTNVMQVTYFGETSEEAEKTLRLIIEEYIENQAAIQSGSSKLLKFYEQEKHRVETELRDAESRLNEWQGKNETISVNEQISGQLKLLADRENTLQKTESELEATKAKVAMLLKQLRAEPERLVMGQEQVNNPLANKLKEQLVAAEVSLQDLLQRFTEKHRSVLEKKEQIAFLEKELAATKGNIIGKETSGLNPLKENLKHQISDGQALLSSLVSQRGIVGKQIRETSVTLAALREKKVKIDELSRLVDLRKDAFMLYGKKLEEGRIATGLGKEQLANLALIGPPHASRETDLNNRIRMVLLAAFVGLALGIAIAVGFEFFNNALRTRQDVEYYLGLPVMAVIPDLRTRRLITTNRA
jgi:uncharacterized protein involved in exopolysaccharide biosynthesis